MNTEHACFLSEVHRGCVSLSALWAALSVKPWLQCSEQSPLKLKKSRNIKRKLTMRMPAVVICYMALILPQQDGQFNTITQRRKEWELFFILYFHFAFSF
jgi:hypothetical protein